MLRPRRVVADNRTLCICLTDGVFGRHQLPAHGISFVKHARVYPNQ